MNRLLIVISFACIALLAGPASAGGSIGTYSGCKQLKGAARSACTSCVGGGNFYQPGSKSCGLAPGMKKSKALAVTKPPPRPTSMPRTGSQYVTVPAGSFKIGALPDEEGTSDKEVFQATVTVTRPFLMKTTEVTHGEWHFILGDVSPSYDRACGADCAVGYVTWRRALEYLNALSKKEKLEPCYDLSAPLAEWTKGLQCTGYRLPTEAEWEWAARGGTTTARYGESDAIGWHYDNSDSAPHPVGKKAANAYGLHDMLGSQWEWTWDAEDYKPYDGKMKDPITGGLKQTDEAQSRIVRGGSFRDGPMYMRAAHRYQMGPNNGDINYGLRPVRTLFDKPSK